jgi:hypothetical protein
VDQDGDVDQDRAPEPDPRVRAAEPPAIDSHEPSAPSPRRWPRRPAGG